MDQNRHRDRWKDILTPALLLWLHTCFAAYHVEPAFALAVAQVESGCPGQQIRIGPLGKKGVYAGPFVLHRAYCREHFGVDPVDPAVNIKIGVRALRGPDKHRILRRYNREWNRAYERAVMTRYRRLKSLCVGRGADENQTKEAVE